MNWQRTILNLAALICTAVLIHTAPCLAQGKHRQANILFYQLTTAQGLSDNYIHDMTMDKSGQLWIASGEGLNMFNGKKVVRFFKNEYPHLRSDFLRQVVCDEKNRIWVMTLEGYITLIDENLRFHRVGIYENQKLVPALRILQTRTQGVVLLMRNGLFALDPAKDLLGKDSISQSSFSKLEIPGFDSLQISTIKREELYDNDTYVFGVEEGLLKLSFGQKRVIDKYFFPKRVLLCKWKTDELLMFNKLTNKLESVQLESERISYPLEGIRDQFGKTISSPISNARKINDDVVLITTYKEGLYLFNLSNKRLYHHRHSAANPNSLLNDAPFAVTKSHDGWVFIGCTPNGISYFKSDAVIGQQSFFMDPLGNSYDGYITNIATRDNDTYYIGTAGNLLEWKRSTNTTNFIDYAAATGHSLLNKEEVSLVAFDRLNRLWVATFSKGIFVLDSNKKLIKHLAAGPDEKKSIPDAKPRQLKYQQDGFMWFATTRGIVRIDIKNFKVDRFQGQPIDSLKNFDCSQVFFSDSDNIWIGTNLKGLWHYQPSTGKMVNYTTLDGLPSNDVICMNKDWYENIYVGTTVGLCIFLKGGGIKIVNDKDGLLNNRVEALLLDKRNRMWMGNDVGLSCFNILDSSLRVFDERYGLSIHGFRIESYHQNSDDELIWGTEKGLQYFYPDDLLQQKINLRTTINRVETRQAIHNLTKSSDLDLKSSDNAVNFYFSSIEYSTSLRTFYQYKLENEDEDWISVVDQNSVRYSSLPAGTYTFRVRASNDNKVWVDANNTVTIHIAKSIWQQTWFRLLGGAIGLLLIWFVIRFYRRKQAIAKEELETQVVINYFASRIHSYQRVEEILWHVAKNCISKLNFEDCVIYLLDADRNVLVQKAAWGPKMERDFTIYQPIEIPVGKGIVGTVAKTGNPELVNNTLIDERYIADDARRYSEIAVPLIIDNKVIGVIDSEHSKKGFFSKKHLNILSTIAVLSANQIQRAKAEEEKQQAKIEALEHKQKVTESRLQSLRLQMNPHFLFNALNSIQQMILANEEMVATRYLSRFSKLLRTILVHSDKEMVSLKEELEILKLYVELESVRFKDSFQYDVSCDEDIDMDEVKVPAMLVQPFVENAIWHGLMHKEGDRRLQVRFFERDDYLHCIIEDNGVGRDKMTAVHQASGRDKSHVSKGISVSVERLKALSNGNGGEGLLQIIDLKDEITGRPLGTRVEISFPILN